MPATVTGLMLPKSIVSGPTLVSAAGLTASIGDWIVTFVAASNNGAGGASSISSAQDSDGVNSYTLEANINHDPGAAGAGATLGIFTAEVIQALSNDTLTINFSPDTDQRAAWIFRISPGAGETISLVEVNTTGSVGNTETYSAPTASVQDGHIIFGAASVETDDVLTEDSDTTNGSWSAFFDVAADGGADAASMTCAVQHKTVTATGNQDWACTSATARDSARTYIIFKSEVIAEKTPYTKPVQLGPILAQLRRQNPSKWRRRERGFAGWTRRSQSGLWVPSNRRAA